MGRVEGRGARKREDLGSGGRGGGRGRFRWAGEAEERAAGICGESGRGGPGGGRAWPAGRAGRREPGTEGRSIVRKLHVLV